MKNNPEENKSSKEPQTALSDVEVIADTPNNKTRELVTNIEKCIPYVGKVASMLTSFFWPKDTVSIWDEIKDQVYLAIDKAILKKEIERLNSELKSLGEKINQYDQRKGSIENAMAFESAISKVIDLKEEIKGSSNDIHLMPIIVNVAHVHLALYRERLTHGLEILRPEEDKRKSSVVSWHEDLIREYKLYKVYFEDLYDRWLKWRDNSLKIDIQSSKKAVLKDIPQEKEYLLKTDKKSEDGVLRSHLQYSKDGMLSRSILEVTDTLSLSYFLNLYLPDPKKFDINKSLEELGYNFHDDSDSPLNSINKVVEPIEALIEIVSGPFSMASSSPGGKYWKLEKSRKQTYTKDKGNGKIEKFFTYAFNTHIRMEGAGAVYAPNEKGHLFGRQELQEETIALPEPKETDLPSYFIGLDVGMDFKFYRSFAPLFYTNGKIKRNIKRLVHEDEFIRLYAGPYYELSAFMYCNEDQNIKKPKDMGEREYNVMLNNPDHAWKMVLKFNPNSV